MSEIDLVLDYLSKVSNINDEVLINRYNFYKKFEDNQYNIIIYLMLEIISSKNKYFNPNYNFVFRMKDDEKKVIIDNLIKSKKEILLFLIYKDCYFDSLNLNNLGLEGNLLFLKLLGLKKILGSLDISNNDIVSLKGCPEACFSFLCCNTKIKNLKYSPRRIIEDLVLVNNDELISLRDCVNEVESFYCSSNKKLRSLKYSPVVNIDFYCDNCDLISLEGNKNKKLRVFYCSGNKNLESLQYGPEEVIETFDCRDCNLRSLEFLPKNIGKLYCLNGNNFSEKYAIEYIRENNIFVKDIS